MAVDFFSDDFFALDFWGGGFFNDDSGAGSQTIAPPSIASEESIGIFSISSPTFAVATVQPSSWGHVRKRPWTPKPLLSPCIIAPDALESEESVGIPRLTVRAVPQGFTSSELGRPSLRVTVSIQSIDSLEEVDAPRAQLVIAPDGFSSSEVGAPSAQTAVAPSSIRSAEAIGRCSIATSAPPSVEAPTMRLGRLQRLERLERETKITRLTRIKRVA